MSDIFISYANEDRLRIEPLVMLLEQKGWSVWWDLHIGVGEQFDEVIDREIRAAKCVIVVWSKHSVDSRWVKTEASEGDQRQILVPVRLDNVTLPLEFRRIETADLTDWQRGTKDPELRNLLRSVATKLHQDIELENFDDSQETSEPSRGRKWIYVAGGLSLLVVSAYLLYWFYGAPVVTRSVEPAVAIEDPEPRSSGTACITPASTYDLDEGIWKPARRDSDLFFQNVDGTVRSLDAWSGAAFHSLGVRDFDEINYRSLQGLTFDKMSLDATIGAPHEVKPGTVFAVRTSDRRYAKVQILQYGQFMKFKWVTYDLSGEGPSVITTTSAPCNQEESQRCGTGQLQGDAIFSFVVPTTSSNEFKPEISYAYNQNHGTVYMGAYLLDENDDALNRGFRPTRAPNSGKQQTTITISRPGRSESLFVWLYEQNKAEAFACKRFPYERHWGG